MATAGAGAGVGQLHHRPPRTGHDQRGSEAERRPEPTVQAGPPGDRRRRTRSRRVGDRGALRGRAALNGCGRKKFSVRRGGVHHRDARGGALSRGGLGRAGSAAAPAPRSRPCIAHGGRCARWPGASRAALARTWTFETARPSAPAEPAETAGESSPPSAAATPAAAGRPTTTPPRTPPPRTVPVFINVVRTTSC